MPNSAKANKYNVKKIVYTTIIKDDGLVFQHSVIKKFSDVEQVQFTPTVATGVKYGNGKKTEDVSVLTGGELVVDSNKVPIEVRADIYNLDYTSGVLSEKVGAQPKDIAIGIEIEQTGNYRELVWFLKGKPRFGAQSNQQSTDNITFSTDSITIGLVGRELDGKVRMIMDTANADATDEAADAFLTTVPGGTLVTGE